VRLSNLGSPFKDSDSGPVPRKFRQHGAPAEGPDGRERLDLVQLHGDLADVAVYQAPLRARGCGNSGSGVRV